MKRRSFPKRKTGTSSYARHSKQTTTRIPHKTSHKTIADRIRNDTRYAKFQKITKGRNASFNAFKHMGIV